MQIILLENYTDYFSRKVILRNLTSEYVNAVGSGHYETKTGVNFNPNDNLSTELVVNSMSIQPNYLLVADEKFYVIQSRWYVLRAERLLGGQWRLTLRRDVIADNYRTLKDAPVYVEKGKLDDADPMICNSEGIQFNKVKVSEELLKDPKCSASWLVGYIARNTGDETITSTIPSPTITYVNLSDIATAMGITSAQLSAICNIDGSGNQAFFFNKLRLRYGVRYTSTNPYAMPYVADNVWLDPDTFELADFTEEGMADFTDPYYSGVNTDDQGAEIADYLSANVSDFAGDVSSKLSLSQVYLSPSQLETLRSYNGQTVLYSGSYYVISTTIGSSRDFDSGYFDPAGTSALEDAMGILATGMTMAGGGKARILGTANVCSINLDSSAISLPTLTVEISSSRLNLEDRPYDMFAIPLFDGVYLREGTGGSEVLVSCSPNHCRRIATQIALQLDAKLYDLQLLPYCPVRDCIVRRLNYPTPGKARYMIQVDALGVEDTAYSWIINTGDNSKVGALLWVPKSSFNFQIAHELGLEDSMKVDSQVSEYRLVSPNYQGSFDFNVAFNGGSVKGFDVYCTYKPYSPFIKVAPQFDFLYGADYGDQRGLICGGDFSISLIKSAWESYQLQNKNYQNIFNREIQNMRFEQYYQRRDLLVGGAVSIFGDTTKGAMAGAMASGSPYGAIAGGVIGGSASAIGYAIDIDTLAKRQREQRELAYDRFGYNLANVQALPYTLTKVDQFDAVSKIWPFLEHYMCTDQELEALKLKIQYEGMAVNRIGTIAEFKKKDELNFFKGFLIRADGTSYPSNISQAIADELAKGVYI